jgi:hypothetical protein
MTALCSSSRSYRSSRLPTCQSEVCRTFMDARRHPGLRADSSQPTADSQSENRTGHGRRATGDSPTGL